MECFWDCINFDLDEASGRDLKTFPWSRFKRDGLTEDGWRYRYEEAGFDMIGFDFEYDVAKNPSEMGSVMKRRLASSLNQKKVKFAKIVN